MQQAIWEDCYIEFANDVGFTSGVASPCVFKHKTRRLWLTVHDDDFISLGSDEDLDWFENGNQGEVRGKGTRTTGTRAQ